MRWVSEQDLKAPGVRLFCLPHAGAGAAGYYRWKRLLPSTIAVCPVQLPGRERRLTEPAVTEAKALVSHVLAATRDFLAEPYAVFGHSMGALLAYEFARQIAAAGLPGPTWLIVSGRNAPQLAPPHQGLHLLGDQAFLEALRQRYGGSQDEVLADPDLRALFLPVLRADLQVVETYAAEALPKLSCPVAAFAGEQDHSVTDAGLEAWAKVTNAGASWERLPGDHFCHFGAGQTALLAAVTQRMG